MTSPYSYVIYEGLSNASSLAVPYPYISRGSVRVFHTPTGGDRATDEVEIPQSGFTWVTDGEIRLATPVDGTVRVERHTYEDSQLVAWKDGSDVIAADLNLSDLQWLYILQEHHDWMLDRRGGEMIGPLLLARNATNPLEAVSLRLLQQELAKYLPLAGGAMTGPLDVLPPVGDNNPVTKQYVLDLIGGPQGVLSIFRNPLRLFVSKAPNASDSNVGTSLAEPLLTFDEAIRRAKPGTIITVEPGVYEIANLPFRVPRDVTIRGDSVRNVVLKPAAGSETKGFFKVDSGFYAWGITFANHQATEDDQLGPGIPGEQAWVIRFDDQADNTALGAEGMGAYILKSPYMQNCTSYTAEDDAGTAGSVSVGSTGGGILVDGDACATNSPIKSMVVDSYTQVNLGGPGCLVKNDGYAQLVSFFGTFCTYHVKAESGGQVNLSGGSTSDFGDYALVADGYSPKPIYTGQVARPAYGAQLRDFKAAMDTTANRFTAPAGHGLEQSDRVTVSGAGMPPELTPGTIYYALVDGLSSTIFQLATTPNGPPIDMTGSNADELEFTRQGETSIDVRGLGHYRTHLGARAAARAVPVAGQLFFPRLTFPSAGPTSFTYARERDRTLTYTAPTAPGGPDHVYAGGGTATIGGIAYDVRDCTYDKDTGKVRVRVAADLPAAAGGTVTMNGLQFICSQSAYVIQGSVPINAAGSPVAENSPDKDGYRITFYSDTNGGLRYPVKQGQTIDFRIRSQITAPNHTFEYVGSGMNYDALPFSGGRPNPGKHILELNNGRVFHSGTDELGNFYVGRQFFVDGTSGEVTISTDSFNISGLNAIGPFSRNAGISTVGVQIKEASDNSNMLNSLGVPGADTVPTQRAVKEQLDLRPFFVGGRAPVDPVTGTIWIDTRGFVLPLVWNGIQWIRFDSLAVPPIPTPQRVVAGFVVEVTSGESVTFTGRPTGHSASLSSILWGDGASTDGAVSGSHVYAVAGTYELQMVLKGASPVIDGAGSPAVTGGKLLKVGPFTQGGGLRNYYWGTVDTIEMDYTGIVPTSLTSAEGLFRDRHGLMPDKVKGVDPAKINNMNNLCRNRADITEMIWADGSATACTTAVGAYRGSGIEHINAVFPALTTAEDMFRECSGVTVSKLVLPAVTTAARMFAKTSIRRWDTEAELADRCNMYRAFILARFEAPPTTRLFKLSAGYTCYKMGHSNEAFWNTDISVIKDLDFEGDFGCVFAYKSDVPSKNIDAAFTGGNSVIPNAPKYIKEMRNVVVNFARPTTVGSTLFVDVEKTTGRNMEGYQTAFTSWDMVFKGEFPALPYDKSYYGSTPWICTEGTVNGSKRLGALTYVGPGIFDGLTASNEGATSMTPLGQSFDTKRFSLMFSRASLDQASVGRVIHSWKVMLVDNRATHHAGNPLNIAGSNAAPPSSAGADITALSGAGYTVVHN